MKEHPLSNDGDPVEVAFATFLSQMRKKENEKKVKERTEKEIVLQKSKVLVPIRKLLKRFEDLGIIVKNAQSFEKELVVLNREPVLFRVYEDPSSPLWSPGYSVFLDHPAVVEIAVPNDHQKSEHGVVVIKCSSDHPDSFLLCGPFRRIDEACNALANFLAKNTDQVSRQWKE